MALIDTEVKARRLARAVASDIAAYNASALEAGKDISDAIAEGRELYRARVAPAWYDLYDLALVDFRVVRPVAAPPPPAPEPIRQPEPAPPPPPARAPAPAHIPPPTPARLPPVAPPARVPPVAPARVPPVASAITSPEPVAPARPPTRPQAPRLALRPQFDPEPPPAPDFPLERPVASPGPAITSPAGVPASSLVEAPTAPAPSPVEATVSVPSPIEAAVPAPLPSPIELPVAPLSPIELPAARVTEEALPLLIDEKPLARPADPGGLPPPALPPPVPFSPEIGAGPSASNVPMGSGAELVAAQQPAAEPVLASVAPWPPSARRRVARVVVWVALGLLVVAGLTIVFWR